MAAQKQEQAIDLDVLRWWRGQQSDGLPGRLGGESLAAAAPEPQPSTVRQPGAARVG